MANATGRPRPSRWLLVNRRRVARVTMLVELRELPDGTYYMTAVEDPLPLVLPDHGEQL